MLPCSSDRYIATRIDRNRPSERGGSNPPRQKGEKMLSMRHGVGLRTLLHRQCPDLLSHWKDATYPKNFRRRNCMNRRRVGMEPGNKRPAMWPPHLPADIFSPRGEAESWERFALLERILCRHEAFGLLPQRGEGCPKGRMRGLHGMPLSLIHI